MAKRRKIDPETLVELDRERREFRALCERWMRRLEAADARERAWGERRRARLRRLTFGLLGREPDPAQ
jgi:hypothetical protein